jgi:hypothetical protein
MKMFDFKFMAGAVIASLFVFTACSDDDNTGNGNDDDLTELKGETAKSITLKQGKEYTLTGGFHVKSGATLTIEPGTRIIAKDDDVVDYILIEQGAKINAQGTATNPIIMTSEKKEAGAWGGLHICGYAPINLGSTGKSEIGDAVYGGNNASDNSGVIRYIRLEYTGYAFSEEKEANGVTFYGVGNGTEVEYLQAYKGSDDGFEWFGGTVDAKHLVVTDCSDDSFDWTEGWCGRAQFLVAYQGAESSIGYDCDCLIEADNNGTNAAATPISCPTLANLTLIGNSSGTNKRGIRLRAGTQVKIYNALVKGKADCLTTETAETEGYLANGPSVLEYVHIASGVKTSSDTYSQDLFTATANNNAINQTLTFTGKYTGTVAGGKNMPQVNSFFDAADYKGAVQANSDWTSGWTL